MKHLELHPPLTNKIDFLSAFLVPCKKVFWNQKEKVSFTQFLFSTHAFSTTHIFFINQVKGIHCLWKAKWIALKRIWRKQPVWMFFIPAGTVSLALATKWKCYILAKSPDLWTLLQNLPGTKLTLAHTLLFLLLGITFLQHDTVLFHEVDLG